MANTLSGNGNFSGVGTFKTKTYAIGERGPGGGFVFYDAGSVLSWGRYLETSDRSIFTDVAGQWSGNTDSAVGGTSTAIGTGYQNTSLIIANNNTASRAATIARAFIGGGFTDWSLPSKDELNELYLNRSFIGTFNLASHWSSSEFDSSFAWRHALGTGIQSTADKRASLIVRPVRAFSY